ncbi:MAG: hypothetical protein KGM98_05860 [Bacteroidota bacterium]|nr:hypothetical protein [Bacteroidota bacterium]
MIPLRYFLLLFALGGTFMPGQAQKLVLHAYMEQRTAPAASDTIYYDFNKPLVWKDFKGKPESNNFAGAMTASGFAFDSHMTDDGHTLVVDIGIYTFFTKHDSWKKPDIHSAYHLLHEQHHFDITRIGAEDFLNALRKAKFTSSNYKSLLTRIFNSCYDQNVALQQQYDRETNHSLNIPAQTEWNQKISAAISQIRKEEVKHPVW